MQPDRFDDVPRRKPCCVRSGATTCAPLTDAPSICSATVAEKISPAISRDVHCSCQPGLAFRGSSATRVVWVSTY